MLIADLVSSSIVLRDFSYDYDTQFQFACDFDSDTDEEWRNLRRTLIILALYLIFSKGILGWFLNLFLFISMLIKFFRQVSISDSNKNLTDMIYFVGKPSNQIIKSSYSRSKGESREPLDYIPWTNRR